MSEPVPWHRLFELVWWDLCRGTAVDAEAEQDLSLKQQFLDLVLIRNAPGPLPSPLPDGFEDLADFNAVTFKSSEETLDWWAMCELIGHFVNLRKQFSPSMQSLLPVSAFRLFAVSVRYPRDLAQQVELTEIREGVYDIHLLTLRIRVIVVHRLPVETRNAMLLWMSDDKERKRFGTRNYRPRSAETTTTLTQFLSAQMEDLEMASVLDEFIRQHTSPAAVDEFIRKNKEMLFRIMLAMELRDMPTGERLKGLSAPAVIEEFIRQRKETLQRMMLETELKDTPAEERLKGLSADEILEALPPETRQALAQRLIGDGSQPKTQ